MNTLPQKVTNRFLRRMYRIPFIKNRSEVNYQTALEKHICNLPIISDDDLDLVEKIKREGVVVTSLESLSIPSTPQMLEAAKSLIPKIPQANTRNNNQYVIHANSQQIMSYPDIFLGLTRTLSQTRVFAG